MVHVTENTCYGKFEAYQIGCGGTRNYLKDENGQVRQFKSRDFAEGWLTASGYDLAE